MKSQEKQVKEDWVNHPTHYTKGKYECKEVLKDLFATKPFNAATGWALGNAFKYIWRVGDKPGDYGKSINEKMIEDLAKARFYINEAIETLGGKNENNS